MKKLVCFMGVIGSGKDFCAQEYIGKNGGCAMVNISDTIREFAWSVLNWKPKSVAEYEKFKEVKITNGHGIWLTGREFLQRLGTGTLGDEYLLSKWKLQLNAIWYLKEYAGINTVVCSDIRRLDQLDEALKRDCTVYFTNFVSPRYDANNPDITEFLYQEILKYSPAHLEDITELLRKELTNIRYDVLKREKDRMNNILKQLVK